MVLDYNSIFLLFTDIVGKALPISIFLYLLDIALNFFFSFAFPKLRRRED